MAYEAWSVEWDMPVLLFDPFRREAAGGLGTAPGGTAWTTAGGTSDEYSAAGTARMMVSAASSARMALLDVGSTDGQAIVHIPVPAVASGATFFTYLFLRATDAANGYYARIGFDTTGMATLRMARFVASTSTLLGTGVDLGLYEAGQIWGLRFDLLGEVLQARAWNTTGDEPQVWMETVTDSAITTGTNVGLRAFANTSNTNVPYTQEFDNVRVSVAQRGVDVTHWVETAGGPFQITDGDTPESSTDTGGFGLPLQNGDQRFTPGNIVSPYYPNIAPGSQIRVRETADDRLFHRGHGYVQYPEIAAWTESNQGSPRDQQIVIPVVDRAAWIAQGPAFISTLGEHIIFHGGDALVAYWPLDEADGPDVNPAVGGPRRLTQTRRDLGSGTPSSAGPPAISFGATGIAPGDDLSSIGFEPAFAADPATEYDSSIMLVGTRPTPLTLSAGQVLTVVCWMRVTEEIPTSTAAHLFLLQDSANSSVTAQVDMGSGGSGVFSAFGANDADWSGFIEFGPPIPVDQPIPVAIRVGFDPDVIELWVRGETYTDTMSVSSAVAAQFDLMKLADTYPGTINHLQVYLGSEDDWTHDDFLAQHQMGTDGLERQSTGKRIRTILQYAGVAGHELERIDDGASLMQVARLAGRNPMDVIAEAVETEQGEFWIAGDNQPVFADRRTLYNT